MQRVREVLQKEHVERVQDRVDLAGRVEHGDHVTCVHEF